MALLKPFKERRSYALRLKDMQLIKQKHPDKVPCIIERYARETQLPKLDMFKFLIPDHVTMGELVVIIRRRLQLHPAQAVFILVNNINLAQCHSPYWSCTGKRWTMMVFCTWSMPLRRLLDDVMSGQSLYCLYPTF
eukprot:GFUD01130991.1.p1 GENE.GFUD01130991.1~~GFUD01130991.1.p1  ORF type:complete len:136 (+),score=25.73 GFUD01130991.1:313-720(+)